MNFQILGPLRVLDTADRELPLGGSKPAAVLALLILHANEVVSADQMMDDLWEGRPPPTAAKSLQVHVSRLRRALESGDNGGAPIVTRRGGYVLEVEPDRIDALRFERAVAEGCAALGEGNHALASSRLRSALALWRGDPLSDFAYASFTQDAVARLDGLRTVALEAAIEAELALGRHTELIPELKSLAKRHPLSERLRGQLMLALYRSGRQSEALGVYRAARRMLVDQLGIEPGAELRELERAILAQDPQLAAPEPENQRRHRRAPTAPGGLLVGYENELAGLEDLLERALVGQGRVALVSGEPGVGKTRLADELTRVARARGAQVLWARCWDGGGAPAFWPWMQVLRGLVAERDPAAVRADLGDERSELAQLLPELDGAVAAATPDSPDPQEARFRLFDATSTFLRRSALSQPMVLVFDDLHAADPSTLSLLAFMATSALNTPILILGTYRDTDVAGNEALAEALTELTRTSDCVQLVLTGLEADDTAHFVELSSGVAPMGTLARAIHNVTSGNPLFVSELVRLLRAEGRLRELERDDELVLPRGIEQVIARRVQRLSEECRRALSIAAVIGTEVDLPVLERAVGGDAEQLLAQIEEAKAARVLEEARGARRVVRFTHDLVRQTLYTELGGVERARLHAMVAEALEHLYAGDPGPVLPKLAYHYSEALPAADPATALDYLARAGDAAADLTAYEDARALYTRAIEIGSSNGAEPSALTELYVKVAEQCIRTGDFSRTATAIEKAESVGADSLAPALAGRLVLVRAELDLSDACVAGRERVEEVLAMYQELGDTAGEARAWYGLAAWAHGHARFVDTLEAAREMLACATRAGSAALTENAIRELACGLVRVPMSASEAAPAVRALLGQVQRRASQARILIHLAELEARTGRFDEMRALLAQAHAAAEGADSTWEACVAVPTVRLELLARNWARAEAIARKICDDDERARQFAYLASSVYYLAEALTEQSRLDEAEAALERGARVLVPTDIDAHHGHARARARIELARGEIDAAEGSVLRALEYVDQMQWADARIQTLLLHARILLAAGRDDEARAVGEEALVASEALDHAVYAGQARELLGARSSSAALSSRV